MARNPWKQISEIDDYEKMTTKKHNERKAFWKTYAKPLKGCRLRAALGAHVVAAMATTEADLGHEGNFQRFTKLEPHKWRPKEARKLNRDITES